MSVPVRVALDADDLLGEGPHWDADEQRLLRVDIPRGRVRMWWPDRDVEHDLEVGGRTSLVVPTDDGRLLATVADEVRILGGAQATTLTSFDLDDGVALNDGACDDLGRLWVGSYSVRGEATAALSCVDATGRATRVLSGLVASNGLGWTPDGRHMYVTDTGRRTITRHRVEAGGTSLGHGAVFCEYDAGAGLPDGIAVDADGGVWVAVFGGGRVDRYADDGRLEESVPLPVTYPTSLAFCGPALDRLFVTTARHRLDEAEQAREPAAGAVLAIEVGIRGRPVGRFRLTG